MENKLNIIAVQSEYAKDVNKNLNKAVKLINDYGKSADLIIFPELFSIGYYMDKNYIDTNAEHIDGKFITTIRKQASNNNVAIIFPFLEIFEGCIYNSVVIINETGGINGIKRKSINWKSELGFISEGVLDKNLELYSIKDFNLGILICYEASFPETARAIAEKGCDAIIIPAFWNKDALNHWNIQLRARALDNNVYVIGVNGLLEGKSCGNTMVIAPDGEIIKSLGKDEGILPCCLDKQYIEEVRKSIPYFSDYLTYLSIK